MKKKFPTALKDGIIGLAFGTAAIIPGVAGGTVLLISGIYKKIVNAVANLFSKQFLKNFLILLPIGIGAIIAVVALSYPLNLAMQYCMFAIVSLFFGLIVGSLPGVIDNVKNKPFKKSYIFVLIGFALLTAIIGGFSLIFPTNSWITQLFDEVPFYLYFIMIFVGFLTASGLIVPGFSGSLFLLVICFYQPILNLFNFENIGVSLGLIFTFAIGVILGFVFFSKLINLCLEKHGTGTYYAALGLIVGSLIAVFINAKMFDYIKSSSFGLVDKILGPTLLIVGVAAGYLFVRYIRKHTELQEDAKN